MMRKCTLMDLETLITVGIETYFDTFHESNTEETMSLYLEEAFARDKLIKELEAEGSTFWLIEDAGDVAGYFKLNEPKAHTDVFDDVALELERLYVRKSFKGKGYGRSIIQHTLDFARSLGLSYVWLGVWEYNAPALAFYEAMGFEKFGEHPFRMGDEIQTDYLMKRIL